MSFHKSSLDLTEENQKQMHTIFTSKRYTVRYIVFYEQISDHSNTEKW